MPMEPTTLPPDYDRASLEDGAPAPHLSDRDRRHLDRFRADFQALHPGRARPAPEPRIPLVLHQIWLGGRPLPERFRRFRERWIELHPEWEHRLWTDREVAAFDFETRDLFEEAEDFGMKSDILRAEVLRRYGGL